MNVGLSGQLNIEIGNGDAEAAEVQCAPGLASFAPSGNVIYCLYDGVAPGVNPGLKAANFYKHACSTS
jgi:hypothetical protein